MGFTDAIVTVVESIALPYGYTLAIWSSGTLAVFAYGVRRVWEVLLFVLGAVIGFLIFDLPAFQVINDDATFSVRLPVVSVLNVFPLLAVATATLITRRIRRRWLGYFVTGMAATVVYVLSLALLITILAE